MYTIYMPMWILLAFKSQFEESMNKAIQGDVVAQYDLAYRYFYGDGVERRSSQSFTWVEKAAQQWHKEAQYLLGELLLFGDGCEADIPAAVKWFNLAAEQGNPTAYKGL